MTQPDHAIDHVDRAFLAVDNDHMPQTIAAVCMLDRIPDWDAVTRAVDRVAQRTPRLRQRLVTSPDYAWVEDQQFDVSRHLETPSCGDCKTPEQLLAKAGEVISQRLDMSRPPWRFVLLNGDDLACLAMCLHHGAADGVRALQLLEQISSDDPGVEPSEEEVGHAAQSREHIDAKQKGWISRLGHAAGCSFKLLREGLISCNRSPINGATSNQRTITSLELPKRALTHVMQSHQASMHDVIYSVVAGGLGEFHKLHDLPAAGMRVVVPMAIPPKFDKGGLGNHLVLSTLTLPASESDPSHRLQLVRDSFEQMKTSGTIAAYEFGAWAIGKLTPRFLHWPIWKSMISKTNCVCTILPGPHRHRYLGGARIEDIYGVPAPVLKHGAGFSFVTYAGKVCGAVTTDKAVVKDHEQLAKCIAKSLQLQSPETDLSTLEASRMVESDSVLERLHLAKPCERSKIATSHIESIVCDVLGGGAKQLKARDRFFQIGIDSMMAIELQLKLQDDFQRKLPNTLILDYPTIESLVEFLLAILDANKNGTVTCAMPDEESEKLANLSEGDLAALLAKELE